ncbi:MAG: tRNA preQ1(34) S-adenosylmethionine ribosyltransferase-isomerase QueA [Bacilli bacterium]
MKTKDFDYDLDESLIAQTPIKKRDTSRLLILNKESGEIEHKVFTDLIDYLTVNDVLVFNNTKVLPARLYGFKEETNAKIEVLLLKELTSDTWECLVKPAKRVKKEMIINFGEGLLKAECIEEKEDGIRIFKMIYQGIFYEVLDKLGEMPLPPYIHEKLKDKDRYQTVYAEINGSAAAPTAGLHFTNEVIEKIKAKNIDILFVTLHVGLGTFRPVAEEDIINHQMHSEYYEISEEVAEKLNKYKQEGKRIISVGTTTTRVLESVYQKYGQMQPEKAWTNIFIYPGYKFKMVDALITNFHLPKSTLLMLVSALATKKNIIKAYQIAQKEKYRFFSFGDSMFIK